MDINAYNKQKFLHNMNQTNIMSNIFFEKTKKFREEDKK